MIRNRFVLTAGYLFPVLLAVLFFAKGTRYDRAFFEPPALDVAALPVPLESGGWRLENAGVLPAARMYERINGKADYYLQYGALELCSGEWVLDGDRWDFYLYCFADPQGARGAYTGEKPAASSPIAGLDGYTLPGQVSLAAGVYYMQLSAQKEAADPGQAALLARELAGILGGGEPPAVQPLDLMALAGTNKVSDAEEFIPESAFGFSSLNKVRQIQVNLEGSSAGWFTAPGDRGTVDAFATELASYGATGLFSQDGGSGGEMFGSWEFAAELNGAVWGVHGAPAREALLSHWQTLRERLIQQAEGE